uniref:TMEM175 n=1 Tax=Marivirga tractuosa (strain ATCC 23168 / DSM 4126 / NBRC 15989 / NCIMB 1408 / VKM B-1430 / H-43) TaxID=643867 RepID=UPI0011DC7235|nr:Chain B, TMEM175 [Marivirga tractuosa DSM 4126]6HD9_B Chain B, TMEM175 [Marivirga tractuosa DSM 4126]6HDA_B Chain B, TMEM175 [Marivirga tractuosa DSM 4126]6HDB_B Chain B, TMEM175 [Marivirga tractuosa DSM 4126]
MSRKVFETVVGLNPNFSFRGKQQTRIETFSDAVFALAITLLVLSSTIPETFEDLWASMRDVIPFAICVALIIVIWYQHYIFFLKYGLQDKVTILLNTILLFVLLVYVYPLKFLARFLSEIYGGIFGIIETDLSRFGEYSHQNLKLLMVNYGLGAFAIFLVFSLMYWRAYKMKSLLDLNSYEIFDTKSSIIANLLMCSVPLLSLIITLIDPWGNFRTTILSGFLYFLYVPIMIVFGRITSKKSRRLLQDALEVLFQ